MKGSEDYINGLDRAQYSRAFWQRTAGAGSPVIVAHRGGAAECLENSMAAFERAAAAGWPVEMDVRATADGNVVVFHDLTLERLGNSSARIDMLTAAQLQRHTIRSERFPDLAQQTIPLLKDVLDMLDNRVPVFLEIKEERGGEHVRRTVDAVVEIVSGTADDQIMFMAFNPYVLRHLKTVLPNRPRGFLQGTYESTQLSRFRKWLLRSGLLLPVVQADFLLYDHRLVTPEIARSCHLSGRGLGAWTVNEPDERIRCSGAGADILITDHPGQWYDHG